MPSAEPTPTPSQVTASRRSIRVALRLLLATAAWLGVMWLASAAGASPVDGTTGSATVAPPAPGVDPGTVVASAAPSPSPTAPGRTVEQVLAPVAPVFEVVEPVLAAALDAPEQVLTAVDPVVAPVVTPVVDGLTTLAAPVVDTLPSPVVPSLSAPAPPLPGALPATSPLVTSAPEPGHGTSTDAPLDLAGPVGVVATTTSVDRLLAAGGAPALLGQDDLSDAQGSPRVQQAAASPAQGPDRPLTLPAPIDPPSSPSPGTTTAGTDRAPTLGVAVQAPSAAGALAEAVRLHAEVLSSQPPPTPPVAPD